MLVPDIGAFDSTCPKADRPTCREVRSRILVDDESIVPLSLPKLVLNSLSETMYEYGRVQTIRPCCGRADRVSLLYGRTAKNGRTQCSFRRDLDKHGDREKAVTSMAGIQQVAGAASGDTIVDESKEGGTRQGPGLKKQVQLLVEMSTPFFKVGKHFVPSLCSLWIVVWVWNETAYLR